MLYEFVLTNVVQLQFGGLAREVVFVMRGTLPGMLLHVCCEYVRSVNYSACLLVGLGANMMGGASVIRASMENCGGMLFAGSLLSSVTLCLSTLCLGILCLRGGGHMVSIVDLLVR